MAVVPLPGYKTFWTCKRRTLKSEFQDLAGKHADVEEQLRQLLKVLCDIEDVSEYAPPSVGETEEWADLVNTVEANRVSYCKALSGRTLYSALYGTYSVTLKELKGLVKAGIFAEEECNKDVQPTEGEGFQEVRRRKRHGTDESAKTAKKAAVQAKASASIIKPPSEEVTTRNFFAPIRAADMDTEGSPREEAPAGKTGRPPQLY
jgi:hypothetical protein